MQPSIVTAKMDRPVYKVTGILGGGQSGKTTERRQHWAGLDFSEGERRKSKTGRQESLRAYFQLTHLLLPGCYLSPPCSSLLSTASLPLPTPSPLACHCLVLNQHHFPNGNWPPDLIYLSSKPSFATEKCIKWDKGSFLKMKYLKHLGTFYKSKIHYKDAMSQIRNS